MLILVLIGIFDATLKDIKTTETAWPETIRTVKFPPQRPILAARPVRRPLPTRRVPGSRLRWEPRASTSDMSTGDGTAGAAARRHGSWRRRSRHEQLIDRKSTRLNSSH